MASEDLETNVKRLCESLATYKASFEGAQSDTIRRKAPRAEANAKKGVLEALRSGERFDLGRKVGEGGMGVVRIGTQRPLGRRVALKSLRREPAEDDRLHELVLEARITGALEHPNVVPVHDIALDADGNPIIVLKWIDGVHWGQLMAAPDTVRERFGARDIFHWNLDVLMQVCKAVHFAHSRGVLHRDLKPENVMIGEFGEVYVLDWGLAVALDDTLGLDIPSSDEEGIVVGTPSYMSPEMVGVSDAPLSVRTDVYLLGAMLHELVTGDPPHHGSSLGEVIRSIVASEPSLPENVPEELASIIKKALAREPEDRFESAEELRQAIADFLEHRGSVRLAEEAEQRLEKLEEALSSSNNVDLDERAVSSLFAECRFAFRHALRTWSGNDRARDGLARATALMVERELTQENPRAAAHLMAELDDPPAELAKRVEEATERFEARERSIARLGRDLDPVAGRRIRMRMVVLVGVFWTISPLLAKWGWLGYEESHWHLMTLPTAVLIFAALIYVFMHRPINRTAFNRRLFGALVVSQAGEVLLFLGAGLSDLTVTQTKLLISFMGAGYCGMLAVTLARMLVIPAVVFAASFILSSLYPETRYATEAFANAVTTVTLLFIWRRNWSPLGDGAKNDRRPAARDRPLP